MKEADFRWDPLEEEWRLIAPSRQTRPNLPANNCPFCPGGREAPDPYHLRVFPNRWPSLEAAEVVLYTSAHEGSLGGLPTGHVRDVIETWRDRTEALSARDDVAYVLCFENRGAEVGATIPHPHGQIYGFPMVPPRPARIFRDGGCRVCADLAAADLLLADDGLFRCWVPRASAWPYAFRLASRRHAGRLADLTAAEVGAMARMMKSALQALDAVWDIPMPYMLDVQQLEGAHAFVEVACPLRAPGLARFVAAGEIGTGLYQNPVAPEEAAAQLARVWA